MIKLFFGQNKPVKKTINNSTIYYYGREDNYDADGNSESNGHVFLLQFDYPVCAPGDQRKIIDNVKFVVTDSKGISHQSDPIIIWSNYYNDVDLPRGVDYQNIPFIVYFDDANFEDVDSITIEDWGVTNNVFNTYSYPEPAFSTGSGPWIRVQSRYDLGVAESQFGTFEQRVLPNNGDIYSDYYPVDVSSIPAFFERRNGEEGVYIYTNIDGVTEGNDLQLGWKSTRRYYINGVWHDAFGGVDSAGTWTILSRGDLDVNYDHGVDVMNLNILQVFTQITDMDIL